MDNEIFQSIILKFLKGITPPLFTRWHILEGKVVKVAAADATAEAKADSHLICSGDKDEEVINKAIEELEHSGNGNVITGNVCTGDSSHGIYLPSGCTWHEVKRKREWRWPWQPKVKVTRLGEGGTVLLSEGTFNITEAVETKGIRLEGQRSPPATVIKQRGEQYPVK